VWSGRRWRTLRAFAKVSKIPARTRSSDKKHTTTAFSSIRRVSLGNPTAENPCDSRQVRTTPNEAVTSSIALSDRLAAESSPTSASRGSRHLTGTSPAYTPPFVIFHSGSLKSRATREAVSSSLRPIHHQPMSCCPLNHPRQQAHKAIHPRTNPRLGGPKDTRCTRHLVESPPKRRQTAASRCQRRSLGHHSLLPPLTERRYSLWLYKETE
jgi:hypothetical protein